MSLRCFLAGWIPAWAVAVFLPSAVIAYLGISDAAAAIGTGWDRLPASTWKVADDVGPAVKLMIGGLMLIGFLGLGRVRTLTGWGRYASSMAIGAGAVALTIDLIPKSLSRGFATALTGSRFDPTTTPIYLLGGAIGGLLFVFAADRYARGRPAGGR